MPKSIRLNTLLGLLPLTGMHHLPIVTSQAAKFLQDLSWYTVSAEGHKQAQLGGWTFLV